MYNVSVDVQYMCDNLEHCCCCCCPRYAAPDGRSHADDARTAPHDATTQTHDDARQARNDATRQIKMHNFLFAFCILYFLLVYFSPPGCLARKCASGAVFQYLGFSCVNLVLPCHFNSNPVPLTVFIASPYFKCNSGLDCCRSSPQITRHTCPLVYSYNLLF